MKQNVIERMFSLNFLPYIEDLVLLAAQLGSANRQELAVEDVSLPSRNVALTCPLHGKVVRFT